MAKTISSERGRNSNEASFLSKNDASIRKPTTKHPKGADSMSRIDIGEVHAFLYQLKSVNETGKKEIRAIKTVVTDYVDEASLKGKAIDASKRYYQATYFPLCDALIEAMNESEERLSQYIRDFQEEVDSSLDTKIDADGLYELGKMIDRIEGKKEALAQQMNSGSEGTMQNYRSELATGLQKRGYA